MRLFVITSDKTNWILELSIPMMQRYWKQDGVVLGFEKCETYGFDFKSLGKNQDIEKWSLYLFNYFNRIRDKYVTFILDDFFVKGFNKAVFDWVIKTQKFQRYELGVPSRFSYMDKFEQVRIDNHHFELWTYDQQANYRISCQPSVWERKYLLYFLKIPSNPWLFEIKQNKLAQRDNAKIVATNPRCLDYITSSALSKQWNNHININGMEGNDLMRIQKVARRRGMGTINI